MTIHRIRLLGDPILRTRCEPITKPRSTAVRVIMDDLRETLRDWQSRFGSGRAIAAPQIGAPVRMVWRTSRSLIRLRSPGTARVRGMEIRLTTFPVDS
jgi:peptide deformylase